MVFSGDRNPWASGQTGRGLGSQRRSLVRRGQRSTVVVRRDVPAWLAGDSPSGAEASSGPSDTCRSTGRGVEEATGIPPTGTPGNRGPSIHSYRLLPLVAGRTRCLFDEKGVTPQLRRRRSLEGFQSTRLSWDGSLSVQLFVVVASSTEQDGRVAASLVEFCPHIVGQLRRKFVCVRSSTGRSEELDFHHVSVG